MVALLSEGTLPVWARTRGFPANNIKYKNTYCPMTGARAHLPGRPRAVDAQMTSGLTGKWASGNRLPL